MSREWQPFTSAPKDGSYFDAWGAKSGRLANVRWNFTNGWFFCGKHPVDEKLTHWMPLPEPPLKEEF